MSNTEDEQREIQDEQLARALQNEEDARTARELQYDDYEPAKKDVTPQPTKRQIDPADSLPTYASSSTFRHQHTNAVSAAETLRAKDEVSPSSSTR